MKVLLINPMMTEPVRFFPLGLGYIARALLQRGDDVTVLDINANNYNGTKVIDKLLEIEYDIVGITGMITQYEYVKWLSNAIKMANPVPVIVGGGLASAATEFLLNTTSVDVAVIGEGENTICELMQVFDLQRTSDTVNGICYKKSNGELRRTAAREHIMDIDTISYPARELFPMNKYLRSRTLSVRTVFDSRARTTNLITSRGCPYSCVYCYHGIHGHKFRARSADNIMGEIVELHDKYGVTAFMFNDDTFVIDRKRVMELCNMLIASGLGILWSCNGRTNVTDREMLEKMAEAGCRLISYGIESGNQRILDELNRKTTVEKNEEIVQMTWDVGIIPRTYLMVGMFGETKESIRDTVEFCMRQKVGQGLAYVTLIPGTPLSERAIKEGKINNTDQLVGSSSLNKWDELGINLTDMTDGELIRLRENAESIIVNHAVLNRAWRLLKIAGLKASILNSLVLLTTNIPRKVMRGLNPFRR